MEKQPIQVNAITEAHYEMSTLEKNMVYMLMREFKEDDPAGKEYVVALADLEKAVGRIGRKELETATQNLIRRSYHIEKDNGDILIVSLMTVVMYDAIGKKLRIKISQNILPYFLALRSNYTKFELNIALSLRSKYSKRLYEMLSPHKEAGEFNISIEELKWRLKLIDRKQKIEKYSDFALFRKHILEVAQDELSKHTDITFIYKATKIGEKYTHLKFKIEKSLHREEIDPLDMFELSSREKATEEEISPT